MSSDIRAQFIQEISTKLLDKAESNEKLYIKDLAYAFEDIFLIALVKDYYVTNTSDDFLQYIKSITLENIQQLFPSLYPIYIAFREELLSSTRDLNGEAIRIVGDVHPQKTTKVKVDENIVFSKTFSNSAQFQRLIENILPKYKEYIPKVEEGSDYIRRQFIEANVSAVSEEQVKEYYYNFGFIIPLFLYLRSTDLHAENVIASLPFPIFFDLECMFCPEKSDSNKYSIKSSGFVKTDERDQSSLTGGLKVVDSLLKANLVGTQKKPMIKWRVPSKGKLYNIPKISDTKIDVQKYYNDLESGILAGYEYVESHATKINEFFNQNEFYTRIVVRPTRLYRMLMCKYYSPDNFIQDSKFFYHKELKNIEYVLESINEDDRERIISYEVSCLERNIIPIFFSEIHNTSVLNTNKEIVAELTTSQFEIWERYTKSEFYSQKEEMLKMIKDSLDVL